VRILQLYAGDHLDDELRGAGVRRKVLGLGGRLDVVALLRQTAGWLREELIRRPDLCIVNSGAAARYARAAGARPARLATSCV
jgi:hypothetical protein